jgi:hypothetical protein
MQNVHVLFQSAALALSAGRGHPPHKGIVSMSTNAKPFANPLIAALDTTAKHRWRMAETAASAPATEPDDIGRTVAIIESAAEKIAADDFSGIEATLAAQALTLDVVFDQFARQSAQLNMFHHPMHTALRAQSLSRETFKNLIALKNPRASQNSRERTIEPAKVPV